MTISAAIVIEDTKYTTYYIIHNSYDVETKYSIISTEKCISGVKEILSPFFCCPVNQENPVHIYQ